MVLNLIFLVKDTVGVKRYPSRLGRAGAVRKRKGEIKEVNGHKFAVQQFYQIMRCALCSDLFSGAGAQCEGKGTTMINFVYCTCRQAAQLNSVTIMMTLRLQVHVPPKVL